MGASVAWVLALHWALGWDAEAAHTDGSFRWSKWFQPVCLALQIPLLGASSSYKLQSVG